MATDRRAVTERIGGLGRRLSTATVLSHHAVAAHLGLGPGDHKCLDVLVERGPMTAAELAEITGLTTGALAGVVARLEGTGRLRREPHPHDGRKQLLHVLPEGAQDIQHLFDTVLGDAGALLDGLDDHQLHGVALFLERGIALAYRRTALLRAERLRGRRAAPVPTTTGEREP